MLATVVLAAMAPLAATADEEPSEGAHNLSVPLIFSEGLGLGGLAVDETDVTSTGLGGLLKPACGGVETWGDDDAVSYEVVEPVYEIFLNDSLAPAASTEVTTGTVQPLPDEGPYFLQPPKSPLVGSNADGADTCWQADWADGTDFAGPVEATRADWGDNIVSVGWRVGVPIRVEVGLFQDATTPGVFQDGIPMSGFPMTSLWPPPVADGMPAGAGGGMPLEIWGTASSGGAGVQTPADYAAIYTRAAHLTIDRLAWAMEGTPSGRIPDSLDDAYADWVAQTISDETIWGTTPGEGAFGAEVNQSGKVVYGKQLKAPGPGWYRLTFSIDRMIGDVPSNVEIAGLDPSDVAAELYHPVFVEDSVSGNYMYLDIYVSDGGATPTYSPLVGQVVDDADEALPDIDITAYTLAGAAAGLVTSDPSGLFTADLLHGSYKLLFEDPAAIHQSEWFEDEVDFVSADLVTVPQVIAVKAVLAEPAQPGVVQGVVSDALTGSPLNAAKVEMYQAGIGVESYITSSDGAFHFTLPAGSYTMLTSGTGYLSEWYDGAASAADAKELVLAPGAKLVISVDLERTVVEFDAFLDVPADHLFHGDITWLRAAGITFGCNPPDNTMFCPDDPVTRAQMASFLVRALDLPASSADYFTDDEASVHEGDINSIYEASITMGCNPPVNSMFCPEDLVTRAQMASFLVRALDLPASTTDYFTDDESTVHEGDINSLAESGITKGCNPPDNDEFCPDETMTRGQMAAFLHRASAFMN
ncbi:MAG: carboxypeptidase regulatory-like domain-containing protein [Acidimicrobiia bacterium]|nr:carboxypeptidase regulatory-like domain-containing protein [Acidimicrobiia bacterium]